MTQIAVLGPKRTFTDLAAEKYLKVTNIEMEQVYFSTITRAFNAIGVECEYGVIPIENTIDGYVQVSLDLLANSELRILHEIVLPIKFTFVANCKRIEDVTKIYTQFKTHNQCLGFIESLDDIDIITTPSNGISYEKFSEGNDGEAAIIPSHLIDERTIYQYKIEDVADSSYNETRFIILGNELNKEKLEVVKWRTSFVVSSDADRPGLLCDILTVFSRRNINLKSIISRPTKSGLGNYNFFIDIDGCYQKDKTVRDAVELIIKNYNIKVLGSYYKV